MNDEKPQSSSPSSDGESEAADETEPRLPPFLIEGRERGLSKTDRRYLKNQFEDIDNEDVLINTRTRIRKRIRESIIDFWLISQCLPEHDRDLIFREGSDTLENWELLEGMKHAMQFFYTGLENSTLLDNGFETMVTSAVHDAEQDAHDGPVVVETEFEVDVDEKMHVQDSYSKFREGAPLNIEEVGELFVTGRVSDPEEVLALAEHARGSGLIESSISALKAKEYSQFAGDDDTSLRIYSTLAHLPDDELNISDDEPLDWPAVNSEWWRDAYGAPDSRLAGLEDLVQGDPLPSSTDTSDETDEAADTNR